MDHLATAERLVVIGHSHSANVADAASAAGVALEHLNFWHLKDALLTEGGMVRLAPHVAARLRGPARSPVFSMVGGAVHQDVGLMQHPRPFDFVWPESPDLPLTPGAEIIPFAALHAAMLARTQYFLDVTSAVQDAADGPVLHIESPPTYWAEALPDNDPGFYLYFGANPVFSPPWLRWKLWRVHSAIVASHAAARGIGFIPHPPCSLDAEGFLAEAFHGTAAHANAAYGALVLGQMQAAMAEHRLALAPPAGQISIPTGKAARPMQTDTATRNPASDAAPRQAASDTAPRPAASDAAPRRAPSDAARRAQALAQHGDYRGAIDLACEALRAAPDADLAHRLIGWRREGFAAQDHAPGRTPWPPSLPDPFPGHRGIPTVERSELTGDLLGGAIQHHGSLRVNGLVSPEAAEQLRQGIDTALAGRDAARAGGSDHAGQFVPVPDQRLAEVRGYVEPGGSWAADCPPMHFEMVRTMAECGVIDHIEHYLGERPSLSVMKSTLRRQAAIKSADWHQDGAFLGGQTRSVNVWLALSPCGVDAAALDVVARRLPYVVQTGTHGAQLSWTVGPGVVDVLAEGGAPVESPVFAPGDALLFDHFMLHRTGARPEMTQTRWAIECWFFAPSFYPMDQVPLLV